MVTVLRYFTVLILLACFSFFVRCRSLMTPHDSLYSIFKNIHIKEYILLDTVLNGGRSHLLGKFIGDGDISSQEYIGIFLKIGCQNFSSVC